MLDLDRIRSTPVRTDPYPFMVVTGTLQPQGVDALLRDFPQIRHPGSIPVSEVEHGPAFAQLLGELESPEFRRLIEEKFGLDLSDKPIMTTVRGMMRGHRDGRIHTDSKDKLVTVLLYFNADWHDAGGHLRILRSRDNLDDYVAEIPPRLGNMVIFQVTDNGWHGHKPVDGKRLSIQMNYLTGGAASARHQFLHRLSARLKKLKG